MLNSSLEYDLSSRTPLHALITPVAFPYKKRAKRRTFQDPLKNRNKISISCDLHLDLEDVGSGSCEPCMFVLFRINLGKHRQLLAQWRPRQMEQRPTVITAHNVTVFVLPIFRVGASVALLWVAPRRLAFARAFAFPFVLVETQESQLLFRVVRADVVRAVIVDLRQAAVGMLHDQYLLSRFERALCVHFAGLAHRLRKPTAELAGDRALDSIHGVVVESSHGGEQQRRVRIAQSELHQEHHTQHTLRHIALLVMIRDLMVVLLELPDELMARLSICAASCIEIIESSPSQVVIVFHVVVVHLFENLFYSIRFADVLIRDFQHDIEYFVARLNTYKFRSGLFLLLLRLAETEPQPNKADPTSVLRWISVEHWWTRSSRVLVARIFSWRTHRARGCFLRSRYQ